MNLLRSICIPASSLEAPLHRTILHRRHFSKAVNAEGPVCDAEDRYFSTWDKSVLSLGVVPKGEWNDLGKNAWHSATLSIKVTIIRLKMTFPRLRALQIHHEPAPVYYRRLFLAISFHLLSLVSLRPGPGYILNLSMHNTYLRGHVKPRWLGPTQSLWVIRSGHRAQKFTFGQVHRWCWYCWSVDHALRTTSEVYHF